MKSTIDASNSDDLLPESEMSLLENASASENFVWMLRQLVLRKVSEFESQVLPLIRETKLRLENYVEVSIAEGGK